MTLASSGPKGVPGAPADWHERLAGLSKEEAMLTIASWYEITISADVLAAHQASTLKEFKTWLVTRGVKEIL